MCVYSIIFHFIGSVSYVIANLVVIINMTKEARAWWVLDMNASLIHPTLLHTYNHAYVSYVAMVKMQYKEMTVLNLAYCVTVSLLNLVVGWINCSLFQEPVHTTGQSGSCVLMYLAHDNNPIHVQASTYQMAILLQFNSTTENPVSHLEACTQLARVWCHSGIITLIVWYTSTMAHRSWGLMAWSQVS